MRTHLLLALVLVSTAATLSAQTGQTIRPPSAKVAASHPLVFTGFTVGDPRYVTSPLFTDVVDGTRHRLSDWYLTKASSFLSVRAQSIVDTPRLKVAGGLTPSPNIAAQAGAIDPGQAAVAALSGGPIIRFAEP